MIEHFPDAKERSKIVDDLLAKGDYESLTLVIEYWIKQSFDIGWDAGRESDWSQGYTKPR